MTEQADSYKANYATLKHVADTLRSQQEPDIDALIPLVDKATTAYKQCKARIEAVKKAFVEKMPEHS
jgi:exodeoxyribonuclease VII small subunit